MGMKICIMTSPVLFRLLSAFKGAIFVLMTSFLFLCD